MPPLELTNAPFSVVDVETTGLSPGRGDRVVEVAVVRVQPGQGIVDEYTTLVNPGRDVGPTYIHGITDSDVRDAPTFPEIAGDVGVRLEGAVMVAHNARFDRGFIANEFTRAGHPLPAIPTVCTLALSKRVSPGRATRRLSHCCSAAGVPYDYSQAHSALADARATALLFEAYYHRMLETGRSTAEDFGCASASPDVPWCRIPASGRALMRGALTVEHRRPEELTYLGRLVERLPPSPFEDPDEAAYMDLLDRCLGDRVLTDDEADALLQCALDWGLTRAAVFDAHHRYLHEIVRAALADGVVTPAERKDMTAACALLGLPRTALDEAFFTVVDQLGGIWTEVEREDRPAVAVPMPQGGGPLAGKTVCFTGELWNSIQGEPISRDLAHQLASAAGLFTRTGVSKKLDLLVTSDPGTISSKAKKARDYGVRIMPAAEFWREIGVAVDS